MPNELETQETKQDQEQEPTRDQGGRFTKAAEEVEASVEPEVEESEAFEDTLSRLLDEKLKAFFQQPQSQKTEPIRSVSRREVKPPSSDEMFALQQLQLIDPVAALKKATEYAYGTSFDDVQNSLAIANELGRRDLIMDAGNRFLKATPDFLDSRENGDLIFSYIGTRGWDTTKVESYEQAYKDLLARNLLVSKDSEPDDKPAPKKAMSGIKRGSGQPPAPTKQPGQLSPEERNKVSQMSDDQLVARLKAKMRSQNS